MPVEGAELRFEPLKMRGFGTIRRFGHPDFRAKNRCSAPSSFFLLSNQPPPVAAGLLRQFPPSPARGWPLPGHRRQGRFTCQRTGRSNPPARQVSILFTMPSKSKEKIAKSHHPLMAPPAGQRSSVTSRRTPVESEAGAPGTAGQRGRLTGPVLGPGFSMARAGPGRKSNAAFKPRTKWQPRPGRKGDSVAGRMNDVT